MRAGALIVQERADAMGPRFAAANGVEACDRFCRQRDVARGDVLLQVGNRARARYEQCVVRSCCAAFDLSVVIN